MTSPNVPRNAYTNAPEQHPNLMLGSLQLLFWLFFHPSAWQNHLKRIDPAITSRPPPPSFVTLRSAAHGQNIPPQQPGTLAT
jgi:hypothetical protein